MDNCNRPGPTSSSINPLLLLKKLRHKINTWSITPNPLKGSTPQQLVLEGLTESGLLSELDDTEYDCFQSDPSEYCEEAECRVCLESANRTDEFDERLISPCLCAGSMRFIHIKCLKKLFTHNIDRASFCPTCQYKYSGPYAVILAEHHLTQQQKRASLTFKNVADVFLLLGNLLSEEQYLLQAEYFYTKFVFLVQLLYNDLHSSVALGCKRLGEVYQKQNRLTESIIHFTKSFDIYRRKYGEKSFHCFELDRTLKSIQSSIAA